MSKQGGGPKKKDSQATANIALLRAKQARAGKAVRETADEAIGFVAKLTASTRKRGDPVMPIVGIILTCATALFAALIGSQSLVFLTSELLLCHTLVHLLTITPIVKMSGHAISIGVIVTWPLIFTIFAIATFVLMVTLSNLTTGLAHAVANVPGLGTVFIPILVGPLGDDGTGGIVWESAIVQHALCFGRAALLAL